MHNFASPEKPYKDGEVILGTTLRYRRIANMSFVVKKAIQDYAKKKNVQVGGDFYPALDKTIEKILDGAVKRCGENKRKTLKAYDL